MAVEYAKALVNLSIKQDLAGCQETVGKLEELCKQHPDNQDVAEPYAMSMFNLTLHQEEKDIPATLERIAEVLRQKQSVKEEFTKVLKKYLQEHPEHEQRYASLLPQ
jgi:F0F1-type ATP synthase delta subunit